MPASTPRRAGRQPRAGARFITDVVADNLRAYRLIGRLDQTDVAKGMRVFGHRWGQSTVAQVERGQRNVTVDELLGLVAVLDVTIGDLLDPTGPAGRDERPLDYGPAAISAEQARDWIRGKIRLRLERDGRAFKETPAEAPRGAGGLVVEADLLTPADGVDR
jgi:transcriptional regulator with XRE-family HTH domain